MFARAAPTLEGLLCDLHSLSDTEIDRRIGIVVTVGPLFSKSSVPVSTELSVVTARIWMGFDTLFRLKILD